MQIPSKIPMKYYFQKFEINESYLSNNNLYNHNNIWVIVNKSYNQSLIEVLKYNNLNSREISDVKLIKEYELAELYKIKLFSNLQ